MRRLALVLLFALAARSVQAQCVIFPLTELLKHDGIKAVFIGTVRGLQPAAIGQVATFDVELVWHGQVPTFIVVYNKIEGSESKTLAVGNRYLVIADTLSANDRQVAIAADARVTLGVNGCSLYPADDVYAREILGDRPGRPPSRTP